MGVENGGDVRIPVNVSSNLHLGTADGNLVVGGFVDLEEFRFPISAIIWMCRILL